MTQLRTFANAVDDYFPDTDNLDLLEYLSPDLFKFLNLDICGLCDIYKDSKEAELALKIHKGIFNAFIEKKNIPAFVLDNINIDIEILEYFCGQYDLTCAIKFALLNSSAFINKIAAHLRTSSANRGYPAKFFLDQLSAALCEARLLSRACDLPFGGDFLYDLILENRSRRIYNFIEIKDAYFSATLFKKTMANIYSKYANNYIGPTRIPLLTMSNSKKFKYKIIETGNG